jgi:predicted phosphohydrolase
MRVAWGTDVHLSFVEEQVVVRYCADVMESGAAALLLGGDIAEGITVVEWLHLMRRELDVPIYFVLGNHDYYGSSIREVRERVRGLSTDGLRWLPEAGVVPLTPDVALVGHGGWGDGRLGDFMGSEVILNDYLVIEDLRSAGSPAPVPIEDDPLAGWENKPALASKLAELGDQAAATLRPQLRDALERFARVVVLTHVPPFRESCWYRGRISNDDYLPAFTCKAMGDLLLESAAAFPDRDIRVLCGHTHSPGECRPAPNLHVRTGAARYTEPRFELVEV